MRTRFILFFLLAVAVVQAQVLPNSSIVYFGDSQTSFGFSSSPVSAQFQNYGYIAWVNVLAPDVIMYRDGMQGVPGETTTQMLSRLDNLKATNAKIVVVMAGTNDPLYPGGTPAITESNLRKTYDAALSVGMKVIAITIQPRFAPNAYSAANEANRLQINQWIKAQTDIIVVDVENDVNGPQYFEDGLHNSPLGAYVIGKKVATEINKLVVHCAPGSVPASLLAVAPNSNPMMAGTGGRTNLAEGTVATSWQLAGNFASTASVVGSKETDVITGQEKQVITISGNYTGSTRRVSFNNYAAAPIALATGDLIEGVAEIEIPYDMTGIKSIYMNIQATTADYATTLAQSYSMYPTSSKLLSMPPGKYLLRTPPLTIADGTVGQLTTQVLIEFINTSTTDPISATIKVNSAGIRHLPLVVGPPKPIISPADSLAICTGSKTQLNAGAQNNSYAYQWFFNGLAIPDSTTTSLTASAAGKYMLSVSTPGCTLVSAPVIVQEKNCSPPTTLAVDTLDRNRYCAGETFQLPFHHTGAFAEGNVFEAQLSSETGSFDSPIVIGALADTTGNLVTVKLSKTLPAGTNYRIRMVSSSPAITSADNGQAITINQLPTAVVSPADTAFAYPTLAATLSATPATGYTYQWLKDGSPLSPDVVTQSFSTTNEGSYRVVVSNPEGCTDTSATVVVKQQTSAPLSLAVASPDAATFSVTVDGGIAPYQYSLDSVNFQPGNTFVNLQPNQDYTVFVKDSVNGIGKLNFTVKGTSDCESEDGTEGTSTTFATRTLGTHPGIVIVAYTVTKLPEQMELYYDGSMVASSKDSVSDKGWLWFNYAPTDGSPYKYNIRMHAPVAGTSWQYNTLCPISNYTVMRNGSDTTRAVVFVSPNFPTAYPAHTELVHTFTPLHSGAKLQADFKALLLDNAGVLSVYDGASTDAPLLAQYAGSYSYKQNPSLKASNATGQLTFKFVTGDTAGKYGWVANLYTATSIDSFYPQSAKSGDTVFITGAGFTGSTSVSFGDMSAQSFEVLSDTLIRAVVGLGHSGDVGVHSPAGSVAAPGFVFAPLLVLCPGSNQSLTASLQGSSFQWQVSTDRVNFVDVVDDAIFSGATTSVLQMTALPTSAYGRQYRCVVDGVADVTYTVKFVSTWIGGFSNNWADAANWSCGVVPDGNTDVIINSGTVQVNSDAAVRSITLQAGVNVVVAENVLFRVTH